MGQLNIHEKTYFVIFWSDCNSIAENMRGTPSFLPPEKKTKKKLSKMAIRKMMEHKVYQSFKNKHFKQWRIFRFS